MEVWGWDKFLMEFIMNKKIAVERFCTRIPISIDNAPFSKNRKN